MAKKKKYQDKLMDQAKGTIGLGIVTGLGSYGFGRVGAAHPVTQPTASAVQAGLNLTNVGNIASIGMGLAKDVSGYKASKKKSKKKTYTDERISRILG